MILYYSGTWSPFECTGSTPPPFIGSSITMTDDHHAVLYGLFEDEGGAAYVLDLEKKVMISIKLTIRSLSPSTFVEVFSSSDNT